MSYVLSYLISEESFKHSGLIIFNSKKPRFTLPADGLPSKEDWLNTLESMIFGGVNLGRELLDGSLSMPETGPFTLVSPI